LCCYYQQSKKPNARDFPECLTLQEISELINGSDSEFDFSGDEDDDEADDIPEPQIASNDIVVPPNTKKSQPISHRPGVDDITCEAMEMSFMNIGDLSAMNITMVEEVLDQLQEPILNMQSTPKDKIRWIRRNNSFIRCDFPFNQNSDTVNIDVTSPLEQFYKILPYELYANSVQKFL
jgi:hypothetical protein